jgi:hypothetical protein
MNWQKVRHAGLEASQPTNHTADRYRALKKESAIEIDFLFLYCEKENQAYCPIN